MTTPLQSPEYAALVAAKEARDAAYAAQDAATKDYADTFSYMRFGRDIGRVIVLAEAVERSCCNVAEAMEAVFIAQAAFDAAYPAPADVVSAIEAASKQRELWLDRADDVLLRNVNGLDMGEVNKIEVFRDMTDLPTVSYYGLFTDNSFEWFMSIQFADDTATTVRRVSFGAGVVGAPDDLNSFTVHSSEDFADTLAANVAATLRNHRIDDTE